MPASRVTARRGRRRPADPRRAEGDAAAAAYLSEQSPVPVEQSGWDEPVWGGIDYDLAALTDLRGAPCLGCKLERTRADLANRDGLCTDCRDCGLTRESVIQRYCALVAAGPHAVQLLRRAWKKANRPTDKAIIAAWAQANLPTRRRATPPAERRVCRAAEPGRPADPVAHPIGRTDNDVGRTTDVGRRASRERRTRTADVSRRS